MSDAFPGLTPRPRFGCGAPSGRGLPHYKATLLATVALVGLSMTVSNQASAQSFGGRGGGTGGGPGGTLGVSGFAATAANAGGGGGGAGATLGGAGAGSGGAGGAGGLNGFEGDVTSFVPNTAYSGLTGGDGLPGTLTGGGGGGETGGGGGGGSGGYGAVLAGSGSFNGNAALTGGAGGNGGEAQYSYTGYGYGYGAASYSGGNGGDGGVGVSVSGGAILTLSASASGGIGGSGGAASYTESGYGYGYGNASSAFGGAGGRGGAGIVILPGAKIVNLGSMIIGGAGGSGGFADAFDPLGTGTGGSGGTGGAGIAAASGGEVVNSGTIQGGQGGQGALAEGGTTHSGVSGNGGSGFQGVGIAITNQAGGLVAGGQGGVASTTATPGLGGAGISMTGGSVSNVLGATIQGGTGGNINGGFSLATDSGVAAAALVSAPGVGGSGGVGVSATGTTIVNEGTIRGGDGGATTSVAAGFSALDVVANPPDANATGGIGIAGVNLTVVNGGTISGGLSGSNLPPTAAIMFTGGVNSLTLEATSLISGNVVAFSASDTLALGGSADQTFAVGNIGAALSAAQFQGFGVFQKTGTSTWTLSGTTGVVTPWQILRGTLRISSDANLGNTAGGVTLNGGALESTASFTSARAFTIGTAGGGIVADAGTSLTLTGVVSDGGAGAGLLTKSGAGMLNLLNANNFSGGTVISAGTLVGSTASFGSGSITDNAALTFDQATNATFSNGISGSGTVTKTGAGTLNLPTANSYGGGTVISAGTLVGSVASFGSGAITDNAALTFDQATDASFSNGISGSGTVTKTGAGALNLPTANSYSGGTFLDVGTIGVGNAGSLGTGLLTMADFTTLAFLESFDFANPIALATSQDPTIDTGANTVTVSGAITGAGALSKTGTGTLTLSGVNTYTGGTTIAAGTVVGSASSFGTSGIANSGALIFNQATNASFGNPISGIGSLTKTGAGVLDLTGVSTYSGASTISAGTLLVDGSVVNSTFSIGPGSSFGGNGTVGGLIALAGSTIAPGAGTPFSATKVAGNVTFQSGSTLTVQVNSAGQTDSVTAGGTATINGGTVNVLAGAGIYAVNQSYTLLTAAGGRTGQFADLTTTSNLAFLKPLLSYGANNVSLGFTPITVVVPPAPGAPPGTPPTVVPVSFASVANTPNQAAAAGAIQSLGGGPLFNTVLSQSAAGARQSFTAVSGEPHASAATAGITDARFVSTAIFDRLWNIGGAGLDAYQILQGFGPTNLPTLLRCYGPTDAVVPANPSSYSVWGQAIGQFGHNGGNGNAGALDRELGGFIVGIDAPVYGALADVWRFGAAAGYTNDSFDTKSRGGTGTYESVFGSLYGGARFGAVDLRFGTGYGSNSTNMRRTVAFPGLFEFERSSYGGETVQGFAEVGYRFAFGQTVIEPIAGFTAVHVHQDSFRESGGAAALLGFGRDTDVQTTTLGFRGEATPFADLPLVARAMLGWQHAFGDLNPDSVLALRSGSLPFTVEGSPIDRDGAVGQLALDYRATTNLTIGLSYSGEVGSRAYENGVKGRMDYRF